MPILQSEEEEETVVLELHVVAPKVEVAVVDREVDVVPAIVVQRLQWQDAEGLVHALRQISGK